MIASRAMDVLDESQLLIDVLNAVADSLPDRVALRGRLMAMKELHANDTDALALLGYWIERFE